MTEPVADADSNAVTAKHGPRARKVMNKIMDAAERLFAIYGIEGVALRQILIEAKQRNKYAISLYFGGKEQLVFAIISRRIETMNVHRRVLIAEAEARGDIGDIRSTLRIIFRPVAEFSEGSGQYTYARFLQQAMLYHSLSAKWPRVDYQGEHTDANLNLRRLAGNMSEDQFDGLLAVISGIFLSAINARGLRIGEGRKVVSFDIFFNALLDMACAAFQTATAMPAATARADRKILSA
jgi:AcrR family transcriptional regulator